MELLIKEDVYTAEGINLYDYYDNICKRVLKKYNLLSKEFDLSHRDLDFRYEAFCKLNSFEKFLEQEKNDYFKF
ncbi:MAG TPA: hypothetical protein PKX92_00700 [Edaphocola sp.]|nr:hypothetical protein [Edaphocola sp.]